MKKINWNPIRKVVVGAVAALIVLAAQHVGLTLGEELADDLAVVLVGTAAAYAVRDPRVSHALTFVDSVAEAAEKAGVSVTVSVDDVDLGKKIRQEFPSA